MWTIVQGYSADNTYVWEPDMVGDCQIYVWARESDSAAEWEVYDYNDYEIAKEVISSKEFTE